MKHVVTVVGYLEGFSFLILMGFAMPMKYIAGDPSWVSLMGSLHGFLFLAYIGLLGLGVGKHWNMTAFIHGCIAAVFPAGPFLFEGMLVSGEYDITE